MDGYNGSILFISESIKHCYLMELMIMLPSQQFKFLILRKGR